MRKEEAVINRWNLKKLIVVLSLGFSLTNQTQFSTLGFVKGLISKIRDSIGKQVTQVDSQDYTIQDIFQNSNNQQSQSSTVDGSQGQVFSNSDLAAMINNAPNKSPSSNINAPPSNNYFSENPNPSQNAPPFLNPFGGQIQGDPYANPTPALFFPNYGETNPPTFGLYPTLSEINRSIDGSQNNKQNRDYGKKDTALSRYTSPNYEDGLSIPIQNLPNPRDISQKIGDLEGQAQKNKEGATMAFTIWGQFLDHDIDLTESAGTEDMSIPLKKDDPFYSKESDEIPFTRSKFINQNLKKPRKHPNQITTWIDGSQIYGSDQKTAQELRTFKKGKLKTSQKGLFLPIEQGLYLSGDIRVNQNIFLTIYHTIFAREHNRMCDFLAFFHPKLSDEEAYQTARHYVIGLLQKITFDEFLPKLLGEKAYNENIGKYTGYKKEIDPSIAIQFSTAAFRVGHPLLVSDFPAVNYRKVTVEKFKLRELFFNPSLITKKRFPQLLNGLTLINAKQRSQKLVDDVRNFLITGPNNRNSFLDLFSLNIQRGRDHGLPSYNNLRQVFGLKKYINFDEYFSYDKEKAKKFKQVYGDIDRMDLWVGIISEPKVNGAIMGQLGSKIIGDTFRKIRDGDRFWYQHAYPGNIVSEIKSTKFSDVIRRTVPQLFFIRKDVFTLK